MLYRNARLAILISLLAWQATTPARADEEVFWGHGTIYRGNGTMSVPAERFRQDQDSFLLPASRVGDAEIGWLVGGFPPLPPPAGGPPVFKGGPSRFYPPPALPPPVITWDSPVRFSRTEPLLPTGPPMQSVFEGGSPRFYSPPAPPVVTRDSPVRLPRIEPLLPTGPPMQPADGTWREDGRYIIINLNGREMRLLKAPGTPDPQNTAGTQEQVTGGTVVGRLLNKGRLLVNCQVALKPLEKGFSGYSPDRSRRRLASTTDVHGVYRFYNVPEGAYKLSWLPAGENQWIRRIAARPDVMVRANESVHVKDIRVALRTIN